jgi:hypothetical protein
MIVLDNFNLDLNQAEDPSYAFSNYFKDMNTILSDVFLEQLINFPTGSRCVNGVKRESLLDHIYCLEPIPLLASTLYAHHLETT